MIAIERLTFGYPELNPPVFTEFNLRINSGAIYSLLGFSGTGKTTLLRLIGGSVAPQFGRVVMKYQQTQIGYVPQEPSLLPWCTVGRNLQLGSELIGSLDPQLDWRARLTKAFGLDHCMDDWPRTLSGGMKQRVAVISAITSGADLLLLDEPFSGTDRVRKAAMFEAILEFVERVPDGVVLLTTHDPGDVFALGSTVVWLDSLTRQPTVFAPVRGQWDSRNRASFLKFMIRETA